MLRTERKLNREISLYEPIGTDKEGNEISFIDVVEDLSLIHILKDTVPNRKYTSLHEQRSQSPDLPEYEPGRPDYFRSWGIPDCPGDLS